MSNKHGTYTGAWIQPLMVMKAMIPPITMPHDGNKPYVRYQIIMNKLFNEMYFHFMDSVFPLHCPLVFDVDASAKFLLILT